MVFWIAGFGLLVLLCDGTNPEAKTVRPLGEGVGKTISSSNSLRAMPCWTPNCSTVNTIGQDPVQSIRVSDFSRSVRKGE